MNKTDLEDYQDAIKDFELAQEEMKTATKHLDMAVSKIISLHDILMDK